MVDYSSLAATADRLIDANGQGVTLRTKARADADASKPWRASAGSDVDVSARAVLLEYDETEVDGEMIKRGDQRALVSPLDSAAVDPEDLDAVVDADGRVWKVEKAKELSPGGTRVLLEAQLRG